ncbi:hypothetical protein TNCV_2709371 [Trichonephila clavipes]|nr:hypothetical protein TNCV_2709371 [Trichonephila clavipes]
MSRNVPDRFSSSFQMERTETLFHSSYEAKLEGFDDKGNFMCVGIEPDNRTPLYALDAGLSTHKDEIQEAYVNKKGWKQWSRDGTNSRRPVSRRTRGTTKREDYRIGRTAVAHCTPFAAEILAEVWKTVHNELLHIGYFKDSSEPGTL